MKDVNLITLFSFYKYVYILEYKMWIPSLTFFYKHSREYLVDFLKGQFSLLQ